MNEQQMRQELESARQAVQGLANGAGNDPSVVQAVLNTLDKTVAAWPKEDKKAVPLRTVPPPVELRVLRGKVHVLAGNTQQALDDFEYALKRPASVEGIEAKRELRQLAANVYARQQNWVKAISYYLIALSFGETPDLQRRLGHCYLNLGQYKEALERFRAVLYERTDDPEALLYGGICAARLGDYGKALNGFDRLLEVEPNNATAHHCKGAVYALKGLNAPAYSWLQQGLLLARSQNDGTLAELVELLQTSSDFDQIRHTQAFRDLLTEFG